MSEKIATREAYGQTLAELAATDKNLVVQIGRASCRERV